MNPSEKPVLPSSIEAEHSYEVARGDRFRFGRNWANFLETLDEQRIREAETALAHTLAIDLRGKSFLDIGCGSGLMSLAARRLGAVVTSFDYDSDSVGCTLHLRSTLAPSANDWRIEQGSALDEGYIRSLGKFDVVYSWGVLHHTGKMWHALDNAALAVAPGGRLFIAIYNYQPMLSRYWLVVKRLYNRSRLGKVVTTTAHLPMLAARFAVRSLKKRRLERGMSLWHDYIDWLGGYPFEVARPEEILSFFRERRFELVNLNTCGGRHGCNEFVFVRRRAEDDSTTR